MFRLERLQNAARDASRVKAVRLASMFLLARVMKIVISCAEAEQPRGQRFRLVGPPFGYRRSEPPMRPCSSRVTTIPGWLKMRPNVGSSSGFDAGATKYAGLDLLFRQFFIHFERERKHIAGGKKMNRIAFPEWSPLSK